MIYCIINIFYLPNCQEYSHLCYQKYTYLTVSDTIVPKAKIKIDHSLSSFSNGSSSLIQNSNTCLVQPVITMKTLNETSRISLDSGYNTNVLKMSSLDINQIYTETMSQSIQKALDLLTYTLFDTSKLLDAVSNWDDCNNLVRYFVDLIASIAESNEFGFTCRDEVMTFVQNITFTILDNHYLYNVSYSKNIKS